MPKDVTSALWFSPSDKLGTIGYRMDAMTQGIMRKEPELCGNIYSEVSDWRDAWGIAPGSKAERSKLQVLIKRADWLSRNRPLPENYIAQN